jgi:hypothetical protein
VKHENAAAARMNAKILPQAVGIRRGPPGRGTGLASFCRRHRFVFTKEQLCRSFACRFPGNVTQRIKLRFGT